MVVKESTDLQQNRLNNQLVDYQVALLKEKEKENQSLQCQIIALQNQNKLLTQSLSFKIGSLITLPFRIIVNRLSSKKKPSINPIKATCDTALFASNFLEISGWAIADTQIKSVEVYLSGHFVGKAQLGIYRQDVKQAFSGCQFGANSGFYFSHEQKIVADTILLKIYDSDDHIVELEKVIIPSVEEMTLNAQYQIFLQQNQTSPDIIQQSKSKLKCLSYQPLISIIVPVYDVDPKWLNLCIESVLNQWYQNWQLCLYDDASMSKPTLKCLQNWQYKDSRISIVFGESNQGISLASNAAIKMANGEFIGLLDHDDELTNDALYQVVSVLNTNSTLDFIYSDEDKIDQQGLYCDPHFKSDFNRETLLCHNYICHFSVIRKSVGNQVGWFRKGYEGSQDHDLFLRLTRHTNSIYHITRVLYHWRKIEGSTAIATSNKDYAQLAAKKAIKSYLKAEKIEASVLDGLFSNSFRVRRNLINHPLISIIIPFRDQCHLLQICIDSIVSKTSYQNYEILLIDNQSEDKDVLQYSENVSQQYDNVSLYKFDHDFNYAKLNNWAVNKTKGELILFLNNDIEVINDDWLLAMLEQLQCSDVAAVGAKLLFSDNTIQHAGVVVSDIGAVHCNKHLQDGSIGYFERANYIQNISACTAACLMVKKPVFLQVGGFDEELFKVAYNDVDLCLKMRQAGFLITYTPYACLYHYESKSRGFDNSPEKLARFNQEIYNYQHKWAEFNKYGDPYFNPNLRANVEKITLNLD